MTDLHRMTLKELQELKGQINQMIDLKGGIQRTFKLGQLCEVDSPKLQGLQGEIRKINRTKCKIFIGGSTWNVPFNMIQTLS
jgi:hypothetical protein